MEVPTVPHSKTHLTGLDAAERFESYRLVASPLCSADPVRAQAAEDASCSAWLADDVLFCETTFTPTLFKRDSRLARRGGGFLLHLYADGEQKGEIDGRSFHISSDRIVLQDSARPYTAMGYTKKSVGILIPRYRIDAHEELYRHDPVLSWTLASPQGRILRHTLQSTMKSLPELRHDDAPAVTAGLVGLLNGLLAVRQGSAESSAVEKACLETMKAHLVRNLHDPELSPATLSKTFHCSRAKVYRLFADEGGVAAFIRQQRLLRSFEDLVRAPEKQTTVQQVAERWGFNDPYHFSRLFKRVFGMPPSEVLGSGTPALDVPSPETGVDDGVRRLRNWVLSTSETDLRQIDKAD